MNLNCLKVEIFIASNHLLSGETKIYSMPHRTLFRPCIDLHDCQVKQIVGGTLADGANEDLKTNFVATKPPNYYAELYKNNGLTGGHVIMLGKGNVGAAKEALAAWPGINQSYTDQQSNRSADNSVQVGFRSEEELMTRIVWSGLGTVRVKYDARSPFKCPL